MGQFPGFVWRGGRWGFNRWGRSEVFAILAEVDHRVAKLAIERDLVTADEFDAVDVKAVGGSVGVGGRILGLWFGGLMSEGLPGSGEVEVFVVGGVRIEGAEVLVVVADLGVDECGFEGDEAGLTPLDGGDLIDEVLFGVVRGFVAGAGLVAVLNEGGFVLDAEDDVDGAGEAVDDRVAAGALFALGGDGAIRFSTVELGLVGVREFFEHGVSFRFPC